jgi:ABC-type glycerol-3-phosphate transport system substrate-binding protein
MPSKPNTPVLLYSNAGVMFLIVCTLIAVVAHAVRAAEIKPAWLVEWEKVVQGAKKEGQVTVYVHSTYAPALESGAFQKAFPDIKLVSVSGVELQLERRFLAERRAGKSLADVFMVGVLRSYDFY